MNILPLINETFDSFLLKSQEIHKESIQKALERYDKELYAAIGWLSREGKLNVVECKEEKELYLSLVK